MRKGERSFISGCRSQKKILASWALCARIRNLVIILNAVGGNCRVLSTREQITKGTGIEV